jgi:hypothetical protein
LHHPGRRRRRLLRPRIEAVKELDERVWALEAKLDDESS